MKMAVYCNNWSSGTLYMCVVSMCMVLVGCVARQLFLWINLKYVSCFYLPSHTLVYLTSAGNSNCKNGGNYVVVSLK